MAAVLNPFLCDSVLGEAMLAMVWHFHGLDPQTDDGALRVAETRHESTGAVTLGIQSTQRSWPMQVVKKKTPTSQYQHLELSDSVHKIQAMILQNDVRTWEFNRGESFDDILPGTLLQVDIATVILKPNRGRGSKKFAVPFIILSSFKVVGCQGENIFGRPGHIHKDRQLSAINASLTWWAARESEPLLEERAESLVKLHSQYVKQHGDQLSNRYLSWLCDQLGEDANDRDRGAVKALAKHIPAVSGALRHSQDLGLSLSIPTASCVPENLWNRKSSRSGAVKISVATGREGNVDGKQRQCTNCGQVGHIKTNKTLCPLLNGTMKGDEDIESVFEPGSSQMNASSVISAEDYRERSASHAEGATYSAVTPSPEERAGQNLPPASPSYSTTSPTISPFKRRDGTVRKEQRTLISDKKESSWTTAKTCGSCQQRLPGSMLQALLAQLKAGTLQKEAEKKAAPQSTAKDTVQSIEEDEPQPSASQETVHASEWASSPPEQAKRQLPPDTDDEGSPSPDSPADLKEVAESSHAVAGGATTASILTYHPRIDREQGIAEAAGFPLDDGSASPSPAPTPASEPIPLTPAVQIPATAPEPEAPQTIQVPATTERPTSGPTARKRRSEEFDADQDPKPVGAPPEDPVHAAKRVRAAFMAEQRAARCVLDEGADVPACPSSSAPAAVQSPIVATTAVTNPPAQVPASTCPPTPTAISLPASAPLEGGLHAQFAAAYPAYGGNAAHFAKLAALAESESAAGRLPQYALDDFVLRHRTAYMPFVTEQLVAGAATVPSYTAFWAAEVRNLEATRGVLNATNLKTVVGKREEKVSKNKKRKEKRVIDKERERNATKVFAAFAAKK